MSRDRAYLFFAAVYFLQGLANLAYEPVTFFLKDGLGLGPSEAAGFVFWMTLPLGLKPLFGLLSDLLPWRGRRRLPHLAAVSLLGALAWVALAALGTPPYASALALLLVVNCATVLSDVACDGLMVERGRERGRTAPYQAVQMGALYLSLVITGLGGGWLAQRANWRAAFLLAACFPLLTAAAALLVDEPPAAGPRETAGRGLAGLAAAARDRRCWALAAGIFLWSFAPFLGTAQFYYQSEALGLSPLFIGVLVTAGGVAGLAGAAIFGRLAARGVGSARVARWSIVIGAPLSLLWLLYTGPRSALALTVVFSLAGVVFRLAWMDLAARVCPPGAEAAVFAAYMSVFNLAAMASNRVGGALYERALSTGWHPWAAMAALSLAGTACALAARPFLDAASAEKVESRA